MKELIIPEKLKENKKEIILDKELEEKLYRKALFVTSAYLQLHIKNFLENLYIKNEVNAKKEYLILQALFFELDNLYNKQDSIIGKMTKACNETKLYDELLLKLKEIFKFSLEKIKIGE